MSANSGEVFLNQEGRVCIQHGANQLLSKDDDEDHRRDSPVDDSFLVLQTHSFCICVPCFGAPIRWNERDRVFHATASFYTNESGSFDSRKMTENRGRIQGKRVRLCSLPYNS